MYITYVSTYVLLVEYRINSNKNTSILLSPSHTLSLSLTLYLDCNKEGHECITRESKVQFIACGPMIQNIFFLSLWVLLGLIIIRLIAHTGWLISAWICLLLCHQADWQHTFKKSVFTLDFISCVCIIILSCILKMSVQATDEFVHVLFEYFNNIGIEDCG